MELQQEGEGIAGEFETLKNNWNDHDFFFLHVKPPDAAGEDGDFERKVSVIEEVDAQIPGVLDLRPDALAITGDHATPAKLKSHSWHGVPFLLTPPTPCRPPTPSGSARARAARSASSRRRRSWASSWATR